MGHRPAPDPRSMSFTRRALMLSLGMLQCFAGSGIIYGWTSLEQLFVNTGVYASACPPGNHTCPAQTLRFSLIFTITSRISGHLVYHRESRRNRSQKRVSPGLTRYPPILYIDIRCPPPLKTSPWLRGANICTR